MRADSASAHTKTRSGRAPGSTRTTQPTDGARYRHNAARHLIGIARDLQSRATHRLGEERGYRDLRPSLGPFLSLIWTEGRPLTAIAAQLGISKQAGSQLANLAEEAGYLRRKPDPEDRRSKLVMLSRRGRALVEDAVEIILETDSEYAALVGPKRYRRFTASLGALYQGFGVPSHSDPALTKAASRSAGVLPMLCVRIEEHLMEATSARGHTGLKMSHGQVLPFIGPDGARIHELARIQRASRQSISATSQDLEALGYLRREPDPRDRRGVVLQLTERGTRLIRDSVAGLAGLERNFRDQLGDRALAHLQRVARDLYQALHLEEEIFEAAPQPGASDAPDIQQLARSLRGQLGRRDAARLAALLETQEGKTAP